MAFTGSTKLQTQSIDAMGNFLWESLDVDIEKDAIEHPEKYPLIYY